MSEPANTCLRMQTPSQWIWFIGTLTWRGQLSEATEILCELRKALPGDRPGATSLYLRRATAEKVSQIISEELA